MTYKDFVARVEVEDQAQMRGVIAYIDHPGDEALATVAPIAERMVADAAAALGNWTDGDVCRALLGQLVLDAADAAAYERETAKRGLLW